ncbi:MAG: FAD-dependent monooxygenase [Alphaproteobacteria bacterium]|nr:FAD-dependent monooxygenase [Alphaproteobacteria bacterium]MBU2083429.1 FAD-dependent monooxygenase [Alphaproteobacteria bacterium]MBU2143606.1 FAD-dependent monooxygenase [Alphaproteobacteria bacterium]MBU2195993.1 FAD-dependent monooxygenase [Alphaproteobacteria bacterium]
MKILIAGGGIGGLTTALALTQFGHDVVVLEQAEALGEVGAGLQLSPNGMKVFEALGMSDRIAAQAFQPEGIEMRMGQSGRIVFDIPLGLRAADRWGAPYLHIHRADLINALSAELAERAPAAVRLGARIASYAQDGQTVTVELEDGTFVDGGVLVGADGIHSVVRRQMLGPDKPRFTGNVAWRAVVPIELLGDDLPPPTACAWVGKGRHAVTYRLRGGALANFVGVVEHDGWEVESWSGEGLLEDALADFAGWHPVILKMIRKADVLNRWALFDRPSLPRWHDGRVVLMGDACHPMLPFLAQGAVMAVEDAWVLAARLSAGGDVSVALEAYEADRQGRTAAIQAGARNNAKLFHRHNPITQLATYGPMWLAGRAAPEFVHSRNDWIYGHDVTAGLHAKPLP